MIQEATPQQLLRRIHEHLDLLDTLIAREYFLIEDRKKLRSLRSILENIEILWRREIHSHIISVATRNNIQSLASQFRFITSRHQRWELPNLEKLCSQLLGPRKIQPIFAKVRVTKREEEILAALVRGLTGEEIATELHLSIATVKTHISSLYRKLGVNNRTRAIQVARELTIIT